MASGVYNRFKYNLMKKLIDLSTDTIKCALLTNAYTFDADHDVWTDVSANEVSGTGYTAGGKDLTSLSVTQDDTDDEGVFDAADVTWSNSTITARFAILYDDTLAGDDLVCCIDFGSDKSSSAGPFTIQWNVEGIVNLN